MRQPRAAPTPADGRHHRTPVGSSSPPAGIRLLAAGAAAGATAGLFGVGGGVVIVPILVILAGFEQRRAHATSLGAIVVISAAGVVGYVSAGEVHWSIAAAMTVGGLVGAPSGAAVLNRLPSGLLQRAFAVVLLATAVRVVLGDVATTASAVGLSGPVTTAAFVLLGLAGGFVAGVMGVGGGIVTVPALSLIAGMPLLLAKGTSLAVIAPTALVGSLRNRKHGSIDRRAAALVGGGGVMAAYIASLVSLDLDPQVSAVSFAALLVVTAYRLVRR